MRSKGKEISWQEKVGITSSNKKSILNVTCITKYVFKNAWEHNYTY
jgi:hypothetical protein